jgi:hypothetical protein
LAPVVSGAETLYPLSTATTSSNAITITSSISNDTGDVTTIYSAGGRITSTAINQTINQFTAVDSGVSQIIAGNGIIITSTGEDGKGVVTVSTSTTLGNIVSVNLNGNANSVLRGDGTFGADANSSYGNSNVVGLMAAFGSNTITTTGNISAGNVSATTFTGALSGAATTAGTVTTAAQPNITSTGTLTALTVTGNISAGNVSATTFTGALSGAATTAGTVTTAAQPNITSVGTLTALTVTGNISGGNLVTGGEVVANGNVSSGTGLTTGGFLSVDGTADLHNTTVTGYANVNGTANTVGGGATVGVRSILAIDSAFGSNNANDPASAQAVRGRVTGNNLTKTRNYVAGVTGQYLVTGTNASEFINTGLLGVVGDQTTTANAAVVAYLDGDGGLTTAGSAYGVSMKNSTPGSGFDYGLDLQFINLNVAGTTTPFKQADIRFNNGVELVANTAGNISINANVTVGNIIATNLGNIVSVNLTGSNANVLYGNGVFAAAAGGNANTGNVTFDDNIVIGTGDEFGDGGLYLAVGPDSIANGTVQYLRVRGGDAPTHIHLDTGNNQFYDQYFGDDAKYVKLELGDTGNVVVGTDDANGNSYNWSFTSDGNFILANGNSVIQSIANSSLDPTLPNVSTMTLTPDQGYSSQSLVLDPTAPGHIHLRAYAFSNIDAPSANLFLGGEDTAFEITEGANNQAVIHSNGKAWTFGNDGNISSDTLTFTTTFANVKTVEYQTAGVWDLYVEDGITGSNTASSRLNVSFKDNLIDQPQVYIENTKESDGIALRWTFDENGNLNFPRDVAGNTDPYLNIFGGSTPTIQSTDVSLAGPANLAIQSDYLNLSGSTGNRIAIYADNGEIGTEANMVLYTNLANPGNIVSWTLDTTGNLTLPGNLVIAGNTSVFGTDSALIQTTDNLPLIALSSGANGAVSSIWVEDVANVGTSNIAAVYANPTVGSGIVRIAVGQNGGGGPNLWDFNANGTLTFPGTPRIDTDANNFEVQAAEAINFEANTVVNIYTDAGNNAYQWQFGDDGNLTLPDTTSVIANVNITLEANDTGNITGLNLIGDSNANLYAHGNVKIVSDSSNTTATWTFGADGNLTIPGSSGGFIKTVSNASIGIVAMDNGTNNPAQLLSMNVGNGNATSIVSAYSTNVAIQTNASGNINTWSFDNAGNLTLPANTFAINYANGTQVSLGGGNISNISNGNSNVSIATANGNVTIAAVGNTTMTVTGTGANVTGTFNATGNITGSYLISTHASADEGGEISLAQPPNGNLSGGITIDAYQNTLRMFEQGGTARGLSIDIANSPAGGGTAIGYRDIPQVAAGNVTLGATDAGKHYYSTTAGNLTLTIPLNSSVPFTTGAAISIVVQAAGNILVNAASGVTLYMAGNSTAANRVVGGYGMATLMKVATDTWFINGTGVA